MKKLRKLTDLDADLAQVVAEIQAESVDAHGEREAAARVWGNLSRQSRQTASPAASTAPDDAIRSCGDFQSLIPSYLGGGLSPARVLLLEDHTRECIPCRKALQAARSGEAAAKPASRAMARPRVEGGLWQKALAAALVAGLGVGAFFLLTGPLAGPEENVVQVRTLQGGLFQVLEGGNRVLEPGDWLDEGDEVRTAKGSGAVLELTDGSTIEMAERSALSVQTGRRETRIRVARGSIIVQAAEQRDGRLAVTTEDCLVSVKGTIFAVTRGTKGSRVLVIEGAVQVEHGLEEQHLYPGDQLSTHSRLGTVSVEEELRWSRDFERYVELLHEFAALRQEFNQLVSAPDPRFSTRLLDLAPVGTVVYLAVPNLTTAVSEAKRLLDERIAGNPELSRWLDESVGVSAWEARVDEIFERLQALGDLVGDEIVATLSAAPGGPQELSFGAPLVMAEIKNPMAFEVALLEEVQRIRDELGEDDGNLPLRIIVDPRSESSPGGDELLLWTFEDLFVASTSIETLRQLASIVQDGAQNPFVGTDFHAALADSYRHGTEFLAAVDLAHLLAVAVAQEEAAEAEILEKTGLLDSKYVIVERKKNGDRVQTAAVLSFDGPRRGVVSWLAPPAPMGALDFISADADLAAALVVKQPLAIVEEVFALAAAADEDFLEELAAQEAEHGVDIRQDFAAPLGGEVAIALDGPVLPQPSWKLIVEVYDPRRLQQTIEWLVENADREAAEEGGAVELEQEEVRGRTYYRVRTSLAGATELNYTFAHGYLVVTPSRALLDRALQFRESRYTLTSSADFQALLPEDGFINFSAVVYQDVGSLIDAGLKSLAEASADNLSEEQQQALSELSVGRAPSLFCAYGEEERIRLVANAEGGLLPFSAGELFPLAGLGDGTFKSLLSLE